MNAEDIFMTEWEMKVTENPKKFYNTSANGMY